MGKTFALVVTCPFCGKVQDSCTPIGGEWRPNNGDVTLCFSCGEWGTFQGGQLVKPSDDDYAVIFADKYARATRAAWLRIKPIADAAKALRARAAKRLH